MNYNKSEEYEEVIKPQLNKLRRLCIKYQIPFFFVACVENSEEDSTYVKDLYSGLAKGLDLKKDYFPNLVKVTLGFDTKLPTEKLEIEPEDNSEFDFISELEAVDNDN